MTALAIDTTRVGSQRPRISRFPEAPTSAGPDFVDFMRLTGSEPDDWQQWVLEKSLAERPDGRLLPLEVGLIVPRQSGKNYILEGRMLGGIFVLGAKEIIYSAQSMKTAKKAHRSLVSLIRRTPALFRRLLGYKGQEPSDEIKGIKSSGIEISIEFANGARIEFVTRTKDSVRGFTGDLVIIDEAYNVDSEEIAAMLPAMAARTAESSPQVWYVSSAARATSDFLRALRDRARAPEGRERLLCYFEWSTDADIVTDPGELAEPTPELIEAIYEANPGAGRRITLEYILEVEWGGLTDTDFRCERLGIPVPVGDEDFISSSAWAKCRDEELTRKIEEDEDVEEPFTDLRIAVDVSPDRARASISLAALRPDGTMYVEHIDGGEGTDWILTELKPIWEARSVHPVVIAGTSTAADLARDFRRAGVPVRLLAQPLYAASCGRLVDAIRQCRLAHSGQDTMDTAIAAALPSSLAGRLFTWKRTSIQHDITPLVAVTVAAALLWKQLAPTIDDDSEEDALAAPPVPPLVGHRRLRQFRPRTLIRRGGDRP